MPTVEQEIKAKFSKVFVKSDWSLFKLIGGKYLDESGNTVWHQGYADNVIHFVRGDLTSPIAATTPDSVRLYNNSNSENALATASVFVTDTWTIDRLTLTLGARLGRYRAWLPEQTLPAGRFVPQTLTFPEVSKVVAFTHLVPRLGALRSDR
jgi:hypothetical protein